MLLLLSLTGVPKAACSPQGIAGHTTLVAGDINRGNKRVPVEIWYPAAAEGKDVPLSREEAPFPVIVFGHGYMLSPGSYRNIIDLVVADGYIIAFPLTEKGLFPNHRTLSEDLLFTVRQMELWGKDSSSVLFRRLSGKFCLMGHSMGGGAAVLAAAGETSIGCLALLAPYDTNPSASGAAPNVTIPALVIAGSLDCVTPPEKHQLPVYESLASTDKLYISIAGGTHCGMTSSRFICPVAENACLRGRSIGRKEQHNLLGSYLLPWLDSRLRGSKESYDHLKKRLLSESRVTYCSSTF